MTSPILATVLDTVMYVNPIKIGVVAALLIAWAAGAQWIDRDTDVVKTKREQWNLIVVSGAMVGYLVLFLVPWPGVLFYIGLAAWMLIAGGAMVAYLLHRNSRVVVAKQILTVAHVRRKLFGDPDKKNAVEDKGQRVHLEDHKGEPVKFPGEPEEALDYQAVQDLLHDLLSHRASDADILVGKENYRLVYRVDGVATEREGGIPTEEGERIFRFLKRIAGLNAEEIRRPQTGSIKTALLSHTGHIGDTEIRTSGTTAGERMRVRFQTGPVLLRLHELGIATPRLEALTKEILGKPTGIMLIASPPQNGMTTTQYAILRSHDAYMHNIHALERRSQIDLDNITQQVYEGGSSDVDFARALQTVLRREPDIVMVSECEDRETAQVATRVAADDRKIYMGIQANDSFDALAKYLAFLEDPELASRALLGILSQRLVRLLCEECREAFAPDEATLKKLNLPASKIEKFYRPPTDVKRDRKGREIACQACQGSGYVGRLAIFELLVVDEEISKLIATGAPMNRIKAQCRKNKMYYLQEEGLLKVIDGSTSMNEILRCLRSDRK